MKIVYIMFVMVCVFGCSDQKTVELEQMLKRIELRPEHLSKEIIVISITDCSTCNENKIIRMATENSLSVALLVKNKYTNKKFSSIEMIRELKAFVPVMELEPEELNISLLAEITESRNGPYVLRFANDRLLKCYSIY